MKKIFIYIFMAAMFGVLSNYMLSAQTKLQSPVMSSGFTNMSSENFHMDVIAGQVAAGYEKGNAATSEIGFFHGEYSVDLVNEDNSNLNNNSISLITYPNPFYEDTRFRFELKVRDIVLLDIYDESGKPVTTLINSELEAGTHEVQFYPDGLVSGIYYYSFKTSNVTESGKIILIK